MAELDAIRIKEKAGILIRGYDEAGVVYDNINRVLYDFYAKNGKVFVPSNEKVGDIIVPVKFDPSVARYSHKVYTGEMPQMDCEQSVKEDTLDYIVTQGRAPLHGFINMEYFGPKTFPGERLGNEDFPVGRSLVRRQDFAVYFDLISGESRERLNERELFFLFLQRKAL